jgi:hypothetical protein
MCNYLSRILMISCLGKADPGPRIRAQIMISHILVAIANFNIIQREYIYIQWSVMDINDFPLRQPYGEPQRPPTLWVLFNDLSRILMISRLVVNLVGHLKIRIITGSRCEFDMPVIQTKLSIQVVFILASTAPLTSNQPTMWVYVQWSVTDINDFTLRRPRLGRPPGPNPTRSSDPNSWVYVSSELVSWAQGINDFTFSSQSPPKKKRPGAYVEGDFNCEVSRCTRSFPERRRLSKHLREDHYLPKGEVKILMKEVTSPMGRRWRKTRIPNMPPWVYVQWSVTDINDFTLRRDHPHNQQEHSHAISSAAPVIGHPIFPSNPPGWAICSMICHWLILMISRLGMTNTRALNLYVQIRLREYMFNDLSWISVTQVQAHWHNPAAVKETKDKPWGGGGRFFKYEFVSICSMTLSRILMISRLGETIPIINKITRRTLYQVLHPSSDIPLPQAIRQGKLYVQWSVTDWY